jgi:beta-lactamase regulating signal transducer with metallopeptidase domain
MHIQAQLVTGMIDQPKLISAPKPTILNPFSLQQQITQKDRKIAIGSLHCRGYYPSQISWRWSNKLLLQPKFSL